MATEMRPMADGPMSAMDLRLERVSRAVTLDQAVTRMADRYGDTCLQLGAAAAGRSGGSEFARLQRAADRQYRAFTRLLYALNRLAQSTDADLQSIVTRS